MIPPSLYVYIYIIIVAIFTIQLYSKYNNKYYVLKKKENEKKIAIFLTLFNILFIGLRPIDIAFGDTISYDELYSVILGNKFSMNWHAENKIFDNLYYYFASLNLPINYFFLTIAAIYFGCMLVACFKIFPRNHFLVYLLCLGAFSTYSYGVNGIKAGAAASIFLLAIAYKEENKYLSLLLALISYGFHHSMYVVIIGFFVVNYYKKTKMYLYFWFFCLIISMLHITFFQTLFAGYSNDTGAKYLTGVSRVTYITGFRPDFILYSALPVFIGYLTLIKRKIALSFYTFLYNLYVLINSIWMLCMYASYTNRIAYLSWFLYPIVLFYPYLKEPFKMYKKDELNYLVYGHLSFTLFMMLIYYS